MSEKSEVDLTGAKQNTGVWLVKVGLVPKLKLAHILQQIASIYATTKLARAS